MNTKSPSSRIIQTILIALSFVFCAPALPLNHLPKVWAEKLRVAHPLAGEVGPNYLVFKEIKSNQDGPGSIALGNNPYRFDVLVQAASNGSLTGGSVTLPAGSSATSPQALTLQNDGIINAGTYAFQATFADQPTRDSNYADGTYALQLTGASAATYNAGLSLTGGVYPSTTPNITNTNWSAGGLAVDANSSFTLTWDAFSGGTASDRIGVGVGRIQDATATFQVLPASATSVTFPVNYFQSGDSYRAHIIFLKVTATDTADIPGSTGFAGYGRETRVIIQTMVFKIVLTHPASNTIHLGCIGVPNAVNRIESSPDLSPNSFTTLTSLTADGTGAFSYDDTSAGARKFYRIAYP